MTDFLRRETTIALSGNNTFLLKKIQDYNIEKGSSRSKEYLRINTTSISLLVFLITIILSLMHLISQAVRL